jgi:hypothetical protein
VLWPPSRGSDLTYREGRRIRGEHSLRSDDVIELAKEGTLGLEVLHDRLDHEVAAREAA